LELLIDIETLFGDRVACPHILSLIGRAAICSRWIFRMWNIYVHFRRRWCS